MDQDDLRRLAGGSPFDLATLEKDYALTWLLAGIYHVNRLAERLVFKGGTAIRKVHFPEWQLSEGLDFTVLDNVATGRIGLAPKPATSREFRCRQGGFRCSRFRNLNRYRRFMGVSEEVRPMTDPLSFFEDGGWESVGGQDYFHQVLPEGGQMEFGFYHDECNFSNYKDGEVEVPAPQMHAPTNEKSEREVHWEMTCGRCGETFGFVLFSSKAGLFVNSREGLPGEHIFYRNVVDYAEERIKSEDVV